MKYTRKFTRQQESKYLPQAAKRSHHELTISIMAGVLAMCFALSPVGQASTYTRADGGPEAVVNGHTADIYAGKMINNQTIAVNNFSKFNVSSGDIANMHFTTAAGNPKADSLVNFSRNSMDINGTINAMGKNGAGTGNIYFLTPQGITVGANGMINATNIYMAVPSSAMMDRLIVDDNYTSNIVGWGENFNANANDTSFPLNPSGTITIEKASSLNYTNSAQLLAKKITVKDEGIQRTDGGDTSVINTSDGKFIIEVFAGKIFPNTSLAVNTFDQYNVKSNQTVYMFFSTMDGDDDGIYNLVNLVNKRINIDGEVDAVKANLNEGNMYFLSPEGTTVGPNGVINAGYYVNLAPTTSEFNKLLKGGYDDLNRVTTNPEKIEINPNSTITVNGVINTYNGMLIRAGKSIDVVSAKNVQGVDSKPALTSSLNFASMVKLTPTQQIATGSAVSKTLKYDKHGDVVLDVYVDNANNNGNFFTKNGDIATINQGGTINARGTVKLAAEAHSKDNLVAIAAPDTEATVNVTGKITGANVDIKAIAQNEDRNNAVRKFVKTKVEDMGIGKTIVGKKVVKFDISKVAISSKATVNVDKNAVITATKATKDKGEDGKDRAINIKAKSTLITDTDVNRKASVEHDTNALNLAANWLTAENDANVNIKGKLHSADGANITSKAHSNIEIATSVFAGNRKIKDEKGQPYALALSKVSGHNTATTTLEKGSGMQLDGGDVNVTANADHLLSNSTNAIGDKEGGLSAAISYTDFNSTGKTEIGTGIVTKSGSITILGTNTVKDNSISTTTSAGKAGDGVYHSVIDDAVLGDKDSIKNIALGWLGGGNTGDTTGLFPSLNGSLALQKVKEENTGSVIIHDVPIKASGKVNIHSELDMQDIAFNVDGKAYNRSGNDNKVENIVSGAALWSDMTNKSETIVDSGTRNADAEFLGVHASNNEISGAGVSITASTKLPEKPYTRALNELSSYSFANKEDQSTGDNVKAKIIGLLPYEGSKRYTKDVFEKYWGLLEGSELTLGNYANFSVRALADQGTDDTFSKSNGTGLSANYNDVKNTSSVIIGKNRAITSTANPLETKSEVTGFLTSITGNPGDTLTSATSKGGLVGGSLSMQNYNNESITKVLSGSSLTGSKVDVNAANKTSSIEMVLGSGVGQGRAAVNGMASVMRGSQNAIAAVDRTVDMTTTDDNGKVSITADNHPIIFNAATSIFANSSTSSEATGSATLGLAVNAVDVKTFAGTTDLSYDAPDKNDKQTRGKITAGGLDVHATSDGGITSFGANGTVADDSESSSLLKAWGNGIQALPTKADKLLGVADNFLGTQAQKVTSRLTKWLKDKTGWEYLKTSEYKKEPRELREMDEDGNFIEPKPAEEEKKKKKQILPSDFSLSAAGSGAVNVLNEKTIAMIDNADIIVKNKGAVSAQATEDVRNLAVSGAGALNSMAGAYYKKTKAIGANGTLAVNYNQHTVTSTIRGTKVKDAGSVSSTANTNGDEMALGIGVGIGLNGAKDYGGKDYSDKVTAGGIAGINMSSRSTEATITGDTKRSAITGLNTEVTAQATDTSHDKAIATGVVGGKGLDLGFAGAYNGYGVDAKPHDVKATISNMDITDASKVSAIAEDTSTLTTAAAGLAASSGQSAANASYSQANVHKQVNALVENTNIKKDHNTVDAQLIDTATNNATSRVTGGAGAVSMSNSSSAGVGASFGVNTIATNVDAKVQGGNMRLDKDSLIKAKSNADISTISGGIGGTTEGKGSGVGSFSYNNINNNVNATAYDTTMYSTGSIGVIAESNDRSNDFAGSLSGSRMVASGLSIGVNHVNGDTNALVEKSNITALGKDPTGVTAYEIDDNDDHLVSDRNMNPYNDNTRLLKARKEKAYKGLVVHSSGTHDLTSAETTVGFNMGKEQESGVSIVGSTGFNKVQGKTNALIKNSKINADVSDKTATNDVNVIAKDYSNTQSLAGSVSGALSFKDTTLTGTVGGSAENNTMARTVTAKVIGEDTGRNETKGKTAYSLKAKNFNVEATNKSHISSVDADAAATISPEGFINASGAAGLAWNTFTGATEAGVEGAHVLYTDNANVHATHDGALYGAAGAFAGTVSMTGISGAVGFASAANRDETGTTAYVKNSIVQVADDNKDSKVSVKATNKSKMDNLIGAVGVAFTNPREPVAFAAAGAMSKNNMQSTTSVVIDNSTITAGRIEALSDNTETIISKLGGAGLALGAGAGASVGLNYINDRQYATVNNSELHALGPDKLIVLKDNSAINKGSGNASDASTNKSYIDKALVVGTNVTRTTDESTNAASAGIGALNLDWMETKVNYEDHGKALNADAKVTSKDNGKALDADAKGTSATEDAQGTSATEDAKTKIDTQNSMVESLYGYLYGDLNDTEKAAKKESLQYGTHTIVQGSNLHADKGSTAVTADEKTGYNIGALSIGGGVVGAMGSVGKVKENHQVDVNVDNSDISGTNTKVMAYRSNADANGSLIHTRQGSLTVGSADVSWATFTAEGNTGTNIANSSITATEGKTEVRARDDTKVKTSASGLQISGITLPSFNNAYSENDSTVAIKVDGTKNTMPRSITGKAGMDMYATKATETIADAWGYSIGVANGVGTLSKAIDTGNSTVTVSGDQYTFGGDERFVINSINAATVESIVSSEGAGVIAGVGASHGEAKLTGKAVMKMDAGNTFTGKSGSIEADMGYAGQIGAKTDVFGGAAGLIGSVAIDKADAITDTEAVVDVGAQHYLNSATGGHMDELAIRGFNQTRRNAKLWGHSAAVTASVGSHKVKTVGEDRTTVTAGGGAAKKLIVYSYTASDAVGDSRNVTSSGFINASPYAAQVDNSIKSASEAFLKGHWDVDTQTVFGAAENDSAKGHADSANIGYIASVGSADVSSSINDYVDKDKVAHGTHAVIDKGATLNTGTLLATSTNTINAGTTDDTTENVSTGSYGLYGHTQNASSKQQIKKSSQVTVEKRDDKLTTVQSSGKQIYEASTKNTVTNKAFASAGGAVAEAGVVGENVVEVTDKVNINGKISGSKDYDIITSAWNDSDVTLNTEARVKSGAGGAHTYNKNNLIRNNEVNINGEVADLNNLHVYVNKKSDDTYSHQNLNSVSFNNDYAAGATNKPVVESKFLDNSKITIVNGALNNVNNTHIVLNWSQGVSLSTILQERHWSHWWWPFSTYVKEYNQGVFRSGTSRLNAYPYTANATDRDVDLNLGYQIGGKKVLPISFARGQDIREIFPVGVFPGVHDQSDLFLSGTIRIGSFRMGTTASGGGFVATSW
jgi:filamentous hemagglutinin family protein